MRVSIPSDMDLSGGGEGVPDHLLPVLLRPAEKRALDLLADWPWLTRDDLAGLLGASKQRASSSPPPWNAWGWQPPSGATPAAWPSPIGG